MQKTTKIILVVVLGLIGCAIYGFLRTKTESPAFLNTLFLFGIMAVMRLVWNKK